MFNISKYLEKFKVIGVSGAAEKEALIKAIEAEAKVTLTKNEIDVRNHIAYVKTHSIIKSQIQIKKAKILDAVPGKTIADIR